MYEFLLIIHLMFDGNHEVAVEDKYATQDACQSQGRYIMRKLMSEQQGYRDSTFECVRIAVPSITTKND